MFYIYKILSTGYFKLRFTRTSQLFRFLTVANIIFQSFRQQQICNLFPIIFAHVLCAFIIYLVWFDFNCTYFFLCRLGHFPFLARSIVIVVVIYNLHINAWHS